MSRIGKTLVPIPDGVTVAIQGLDDGCQRVDVKGKLGELRLDLLAGIQVTLAGSILAVERIDDTRRSRAAHGLTRALIANMVKGVSEGFVKALEIQGLGYKARLDGRNLVLSLGYCHPITYPIPEGISVELESETAIRVMGRLREGGIIRSDRGEIVVLDEVKLRLLSEGSPRV